MPKAWQLPSWLFRRSFGYFEDAALKIVWGIVNLLAWPVF